MVMCPDLPDCYKTMLLSSIRKKSYTVTNILEFQIAKIKISCPPRPHNLSATQATMLQVSNTSTQQAHSEKSN